MRKAILAFCCAAAFGLAFIGDAVAYERLSDSTPQITEHHWGGGRGYHRGGWGGGRRSWGGGCYGGGY